MFRERIDRLRVLMVERGIDLYVVPTGDYHLSEYVGDYFKTRKFLSGFTGSAGTLIVTKEEAGLFTDGRYFIQAEKELEGSGIILFRTGTAGVPTVEEYCAVYMQKHNVIGFDGRTVTKQFVDAIERKMNGKKLTCAYEEDLAGSIWSDRPELSAKPVSILDERYAGEPVSEKLERIRKIMKEKGAESHLLTSLDDIAWVFNIRGNDVENNPVALAYALITDKNACLYLQKKTVSKEVEVSLGEAGVVIQEYDLIYDALQKQLSSCKSIMLDVSKVNYALYSLIPEHCQKLEERNPSVMMKAIKNMTEIQNAKVIHIKDGVAVTKFMYWLKTNIGKTPMDEYSVGKKMDAMRLEIPECKDLSFDTICAYGANAAMMHYSAKENDCAELKTENFLLVDCGGQYLEGTTDVTRTFVLGELTAEQKKHFTAVVSGMLRLQNARFLYGCNGFNLDILSRGAVWEMGIDYQCGTGHGVGSYLNVHEGPNGFRWKSNPGMKYDWNFEEGMITTDEPGVYIEGSHGIRIENELLCVKDVKNEWGQFMKFEVLTYVPIDLDGIDVTYMQEKDLKMLNAYHAEVYKKLLPYMNEEEKLWLKNATRPLEK